MNNYYVSQYPEYKKYLDDPTLNAWKTRKELERLNEKDNVLGKSIIAEMIGVESCYSTNVDFVSANCTIPVSDNCNTGTKTSITRNTYLGDVIIVQKKLDYILTLCLDFKLKNWISENELAREYKEEMWVVFNLGVSSHWFAVRLTPESRKAMKMYKSYRTSSHNSITTAGYNIIYTELLSKVPTDVVIAGSESRYPKDREVILAILNKIRDSQFKFNEDYKWLPETESEDLRFEGVVKISKKVWKKELEEITEDEEVKLDLTGQPLF